MKTSDSHKGLRGRCTTPNDMAVHEHMVATASSSKLLETFNNPTTERDYIIQIRIPEFTCLCPKTGQPDFATLELEYVPADSCLELKSLKQYVWSYRDQGVFHEAVTNTILTDLVSALSPRFARLAARFNVRGGIYTTVIVEHRAEGWAPTEPIEVLRGASSDGMS